MQVDVDDRAFEALSQHARVADLAAIARAVMSSAAVTHRAEPQPDRLAELAAKAGLTREEAATPLGNALDVLGRGPENGSERGLARALAAHAVALHPPGGPEEQERWAAEILWLAARTPFDATGLLDRALGERAAGLWEAIAERVRRFDQGTIASLDRGEAVAGAVALSSSSAPGAAKRAAEVAADMSDHMLVKILSASGHEPIEPMTGEMTPPPRNPLMTVLLALSGLLLVLQAWRLFRRGALAYKRPAQVGLAKDGGLRIHWHTELLGRMVRDGDVLVPRSGLIQASREVRFPRIALYSGLLALAVGSYVGVSAFVDGVRAASPSLLASGLTIIALGLAADFVLSSVAPGTRGRCRVLIVPREGRTICIGDVDVRAAEAFLARLAGR
jgi:hypothetical protein